jgi:CRP-like cAMP-binding protein
MPRQAARPELLHSLSLFATLSRLEVLILSRLMSETTVRKHTVIVREGNRGGEFFVVAEGVVEIRQGSRRIARLGPGEFFGEIALLEGVPRTATVIATEDCTLLVASSQEFDAMLATEPEVERKIMTAMEERSASGN